MSAKLIRIFKALLPAPFTIAVILSAITFLLAYFLSPKDVSALQLLTYWEEGLWNAPLLVFAVQMMLMLVLGHSLALSEPFSNIISNITIYCNNTANAAAIVKFPDICFNFS